MFEVAVVQLGEPGRVKLTAEITSGDKVRIAEVIISGNTSTRESFIRDRVEMKVGISIRAPSAGKVSENCSTRGFLAKSP